MPSACLAREHGERLPAISSKNRLVMLEFSGFPDLLQPILAILSSVSESGRDETTFVFNGDFVASTSELAAKRLRWVALKVQNVQGPWSAPAGNRWFAAGSKGLEFLLLS